MAAGIPAGLSAAQGRKFGLTVGGAFLALGLLLRWRGRYRASVVFLGLGALLVLAALVAPTILGPVERAWMAAARAISKVTTPIVMGVVYFVIMTPIGFLRRRMGGPIRVHAHGTSRWERHVAPPDPRENMEHQY